MIRFASGPFPDRTIGELSLDMALLFVSTQKRVAPRELVEVLREGQRDVHADLRLQIARTLSTCLRWEATEIRSIHVIGSTVEHEARKTSDLDLVLRIPETDPRIEASFALINEDISRAYRDLMQDVSERFRLLDPHFVTDEAFERGGGIAVTLESSQVPRFPINPISPDAIPDRSRA